MQLLQMRRLLESGKSIFDLPLRVAYYARVSTDRDEQLNSLTNQVNYYESYIKENKQWIFSGAYIDEGISGTSTEKRNEFQRMIKDAHDDLFDLVITKEISRFSRNTLDSIKYTRELLECGVGVYFQNDNINTLSSDAELRLTIMSSIAQDEVRRLSERVKFGMKRAYESGKILGQNNMYGYEKKGCVLSIKEEEAMLVKTLFGMYAEGKYGFRTIARKMTEMGFRNQSGGEINPGTLRGVLENPKYKGFYCGRKTESIDYIQKKSIKLPEEERLYYRDENIPAIVSEELWDKVNAMLAKRREKYKKKETQTQHRYPYSGKIECETHGTYFYRIVRKARKRHRECWSCKIRVAKGKSICDAPEIGTEELCAIMEYIGAKLLDNKDDVKNSLIQRYRNIDNNGIDLTSKLLKHGRELEKLLAKKQTLLEYSLEGTISKDEFKTMNARLDNAVREEKASIANLERERNRSKDSALFFRELEGYLAQTLDESLVPREIAHSLLEKIVVMQGSTKENTRLEITLRHGELYRALIANLNILYGDTEVSPIVGTEKESEELVRYLLSEFETDPGMIWETNIFGKSLNELVREGLSNKLSRMPEDVQMKFQETLQKIINEGSNGLICILL